MSNHSTPKAGSPQEETELCLSCGHTEDDHDGYGGLCDGFGYNDSRQVCPCISFIRGDSASLPLAPKATPDISATCPTCGNLLSKWGYCSNAIHFYADFASRIAPTADFKELLDAYVWKLRLVTMIGEELSHDEIVARHTAKDASRKALEDYVDELKGEIAKLRARSVND